MAVTLNSTNAKCFDRPVRLFRPNFKRVTVPNCEKNAAHVASIRESQPDQQGEKKVERGETCHLLFVEAVGNVPEIYHASTFLH